MSIKIEDSWKQLLNSEFNKNYFKELISFVKSEYLSSICYPKGSKIFSAFDNCPINELKVVILVKILIMDQIKQMDYVSQLTKELFILHL